MGYKASDSTQMCGDGEDMWHKLQYHVLCKVCTDHSSVVRQTTTHGECCAWLVQLLRQAVQVAAAGDLTGVSAVLCRLIVCSRSRAGHSTKPSCSAPHTSVPCASRKCVSVSAFSVPTPDVDRCGTGAGRALWSAQLPPTTLPSRIPNKSLPMSHSLAHTFCFLCFSLNLHSALPQSLIL